MSFLTAILGGYGAYGAGKAQAQQTAFQENLASQQEADYQKQLAQQSAAFKQTSAADLASRGLDVNTPGAYWDDASQQWVGAKPFTPPSSLMRIVPHPVGPNYKVTPEDLYSHAMDWANYYTRTGQTNMAALSTAQAANIYTQMAAQAAQDARFRDALLEIGARGQTAVQVAQALSGIPQRQTPLASSEQSYLDRYGILPRGSGTTTNPQVENLYKTYETQKAQAASSGSAFTQLEKNALTPVKNPITDLPVGQPPIPFDLQQQYKETKQMIMQSPTPAAAAQGYIQALLRAQPQMANSAYVKVLTALGQWQQQLRTMTTTQGQYQKALKTSSTGLPVYGAAPGGSQATTNPRVGQLESLWIQAGGDPQYAPIMAQVALSESGGNPNSNRSGATSYVQNGKTYYPQGIWQISTIHNLPNMFDPMANAKAAVNLFNAGMARGDPFGPWEASRGGPNGWGQYLGDQMPEARPSSTIDPATLMLIMSLLNGNSSLSTSVSGY